MSCRHERASMSYEHSHISLGRFEVFTKNYRRNFLNHNRGLHSSASQQNKDRRAPFFSAKEIWTWKGHRRHIQSDHSFMRISHKSVTGTRDRHRLHIISTAFLASFFKQCAFSGTQKSRNPVCPQTPDKQYYRHQIKWNRTVEDGLVGDAMWQKATSFTYKSLGWCSALQGLDLKQKLLCSDLLCE